MTSFLILFSYISTVTTITALFIILVTVCINSKLFSTGDILNNCVSHLKSCKVMSVVFIVFAWLVASGNSRTVCLTYYAEIGDACFYQGCIWSGFSFITVLFDICYTLINHKSSATVSIRKNIGTNFILGIVFFMMSFLLSGMDVSVS